MPNKIGRFDILSEITNSPTGSVYKASDPESGQTVALKTLKLEVFGDQAAALVQSVLEEAETTKSLNSHNIALVYGAGELEGLFCAALEYVQGNSIATMLARKEGFSIWDLQDIARQTCQGLDHAHAKAVFHYSLEPAKIMVQWDGTVKMLGFGVSLMSAHARHASGQPTDVLHYMSPEQLRGEPLDARSNLFSLGAVLYEMVTERKAFEGEDADQVQQQILEQMPPSPLQINRKVHPALSEVIMKALAKAPQERHQSGQDLVNDLERCKESATKTAAKAGQPAQGLNLPPKQKPAASAPQPVKQTPVVTAPAKPVAPKPQASLSRPPAAVAKVARPAPPPSPVATQKVAPEFEVGNATGAEPDAPEWKAAAAAAGWPGAGASASPQTPRRTPKLDPTEQFISSCVKASVGALAGEQARMSAATAEPEVETPSIKVDPMMAEPSEGGGTPARSFSEIDELPPLKEIYIAPPAPPAPEVSAPMLDPAATIFREPTPEKPRIQPKEVAKKAVAEIKKTPPKLFVYSVAGAIGFILLLIVAIAFHIHNENADEDSDLTQSSPAAAATAQRSTAQSGAQAPAPQTPPPAQVAPEPVTEEPAEVSVRPKYNNKKKPARTPAPAPVVIPGQLTVNSTPEGAQLHFDGRNDASWVTPYNLTGLAPGQHTVTVTKPGYASETRNIEVASGSKSFLVVQLAPLTASVSVASEPAGAAIFVDGKDTGRLTPAQISVSKPGEHTVLLKKTGYLEETATANLQAGQVFHFAPALRVLGSTDDIKTVSKFKKVFGGGDPAGMGTVSIKTQPKGAQIAVNQRIIDKVSPVQVYLNPGTYVIDITMSEFKPVHRVISVDKGGKVALDETLER